MKRLLSFLLAVVLLLGCGVAAVSAENSKLLPDLQEALKTMEPDDEIGLYICYSVPMVTVADMPSWPEVYEARKEYFAFTAKQQAEIQAIIFDGIDVEIGFEGVDDMVLAHVKVSEGWTDQATGEREFRPLANVARADMAAFLHRLDGVK